MNDTKIHPRFICDRCGKRFNAPEMVRECVGEYWGRPVYESQPLSPCCHDIYYLAEYDDEQESR